jgi:hypothetical protein
MILRPITTLAGPEPHARASIAAGGVEDDNIFSTATGKEKDVISRLTPELEIGAQSEPLTLIGRYTFDAERFADHPELDNSRMRERASLDLQTATVRPWSLTLAGAFFRTQTPSELNTATGVLAGRAGARRLEIGSTVTRRFDPSTSISSGLTFVRDELSGGAGIGSRIGSLSFERGLTPRDRLSADYQARRFDFDPGRPILVHAVTFGWAREATARTGFTLRAGPRLVDGSARPELSASLDHRLKRGVLSCAYTDSTATIIGQAGVASFESLVVAAEVQPLRSLSLRAAPSAVRVRSADAATETRLYLGTLGATWRIVPWLALEGSYQFTLQRAPSALADQEISRHIVLLRLVAISPGKADEGRRR